jgi:hypothetical protein
VTSPRPAFRASFQLDLAPSVPTSRFAVDAAATVFEAAFQQIELDAPASTLRDLSGGTAVCELAAPREVRLVRLSNSLALESGASYSILLHRLDRDVPAPKPTVTVALGANRTATIPAGFADARFAVMLQKGTNSPEPLAKAKIAQIGLRSAPSAPRIALGAVGADPEPPFWQAAGELHTGDAAAAVHGGAALAAALQQLLDAAAGPAPARVTVSIDSDAPCALVITAFDARYSFVSETFAFDALADADLVDAAALVAALATGTDPVSTYVRSSLSKALQAELRAAGTAKPGDALVASVRGELDGLIRSAELYDASRFGKVELRDETKLWLTAPGGAALAVRNRLLLEDAYPGAIASPAEKRVLRFPAGRIVEREAFVRLPAAASVGKATVRTNERLRGERPTEGGLAAADGVAATKAGLHVAGEAQIAVRIVQPEAVTASGLALALLPLEPETEVDVEVQEDWNGAPSGRIVAAGRASLHELGGAGWATVFFDDQPVLDANPYWLVLQARQGGAVWLTEPADAALRALRGDATAGWEREQASGGLRALYRVFSRVANGDAQPPTGLTVAGGSVAGTAQNGDRTYDLAAALNAGLAGAAPGLVSLPLDLTATVAGSITVYPPRIEYDVAT